ncbi:MAG: cobalamin-dependent protein [Deltaproteobacteria bacterium]|nr:cobalamin-dependent protein [Deltaproteobacteria bacterium]MBN2672735.1 cobalamin-dependent protein [Deltaproteobacteria bacterium]
MVQSQPSVPFTETVFKTYLAALIRGDSSRCLAIVKELIDTQIDIRDLYTQLFQSSLYEVGRLWEQNKISVAREHLATAITDRAMHLAYPRLFAEPPNGRKRAVVSCAANEMHQIGGKMVADILELNHWDTHFLGANTPTDQLLTHIEEESASLVALSLSVYFNMPSLIQLITLVRETYPGIKIIVGGQAFLYGGVDAVQSFEAVTYFSSIVEMEARIGKGIE